MVQGAAVWLVSLPLQAAAVTDLTTLWPVGLGVAVWGVGMVFEVVGDAQLAAYRRPTPRPATPGARHRPVGLDPAPELLRRRLYVVGDLARRRGLRGLAAGLLTVVAPVTMTYFLRNVTGAALLEQTMSQRPGWDDYAARVPLFFPRPPRG